ncbi:hypothetical protein 2016DhaA_0645 [Vibrio phage ICP1]|jgi:hypothetical protein|uniref:Uncharacterized protein ORF132 n=1 Tax=Vibrio phage ICP1 TaxID=979525 RepID=F1D1F5_9CAUD|nr:hypothetical protein ViPhICP1_gp133 [Vibrio phage ICP1]ADX88178.1 hypothetical protein TUST1-191_00660 [Vibrio phage ICP1_2006_D]ADX88405.1 hypothetical protein TUST1-182_00660 [Vibrio phage ICP1_2006_C]ADX88630.1 hypothetical protein TUST1-159_00650 [Vibrio phage ICP1_2006_B]ADX88856.1 hypothetical protein TUST1-17_00650 [Vibrio phage ICP1_2006_A]ADX89087.1 hypothetical protein TUST1-15_00675 [Vibrio phage ICP1_2005_A]ADX89312.1 hypothetical protein TUST1-2_00660 [Vibrio phage ICP1_2001_A
MKCETTLVIVLSLTAMTTLGFYGINLHHERETLIARENLKLEEYRLVTERKRVVNEGNYFRALELKCTEEFVTRDGEHYRRQWGSGARKGR